jgi:hypothetical protein
VFSNRSQFWIIGDNISNRQRLTSILGRPQNFSTLQAIVNLTIRYNFAQGFFYIGYGTDLRYLGRITINVQKQSDYRHGSFAIARLCAGRRALQTIVNTTILAYSFTLKFATLLNGLGLKFAASLVAIPEVLVGRGGRCDGRTSAQEFQRDLTGQILNADSAIGFSGPGQPIQRSQNEIGI